MPGVPGIDTSAFPGSAVMAWLKANTNLLWCGYYLAPAPSHGNTGWMGHRAALQAAGWGLAPTYLGQQMAGPGSHVVTAAQGAIDGAHAASLMRAESFAPGSFAYLDLEDGPPFVSPRKDYVAAWVTALKAGGFQPGVYCSHGIGDEVQAAHPEARIWAFKVRTVQPEMPGPQFPDSDPAGSGNATAYMWQLGQNRTINVAPAPGGKLLADLNSAVAADPSAP